VPEAIFEDGPVSTPYVYTVTGHGSVTPRACAAVYDGSGAGGDYVPAVIFRSQTGNVIARATLDSTIVAGDDAEVSWFPGVKHAPSVTPGGTQCAYAILSLSVANFTDTGFTVANNTVTNVRFPHQSSTDSVPFSFLPSTTYSDTIRLKSDAYVYVCYSSVRWHLAGFNQYSSIIGPSPSLPGSFLFGALNNHGETPANQFSAGDLFSGSPLWGVDTKSFVCETAPQDVTLTAFQTAGADRVIDEANLLCVAYTF
jgi:hypothetical protein